MKTTHQKARSQKIDAAYAFRAFKLNQKTANEYAAGFGLKIEQIGEKLSLVESDCLKLDARGFDCIQLNADRPCISCLNYLRS